MINNDDSGMILFKLKRLKALNEKTEKAT